MTMDLPQLLLVFAGLLLGGLLGALTVHFRSLARLEKLKADAEREGALQRQAMDQQTQKLAILERSESEKSSLLDALRQQLNDAEKRLATAEEQSRQQKLLSEKLSATEQLVVEQQHELMRGHGEVKDLKARLESAQRETQEKLQLLQEAKEQMKLEFQSIANKLFEDKSEKFTQQNKTNMGAAGRPVPPHPMYRYCGVHHAVLISINLQTFFGTASLWISISGLR